MSAILVVGSLAYDTIRTPYGKVERALGGSANYFSLAASLLSPVRVVGVVGEDYSADDFSLLKSRNVDLSGLEKVPGKTFHWEGYYEGDMNEAKTLRTELNVFEHFNPRLPESYRNSEVVFLANIAPELQLKVLDQVQNPRFVGMDTMNFWINSKMEQLKKILARVDVLLINEGESEMLTGEPNAIAAAPRIIEMGPKTVVIKRGEYGFAMYSKDEGFFILPAMPIPRVIDPTGAGDTFAGGFFGHIASLNRLPTNQDLRQACVVGSIMASFTIEDFGLNALARLGLADVELRMGQYRQVIRI